MKPQTLLAFVLSVLFMMGCAPAATPIPPTLPPPTPDAKATETTIAANIFATQTASIPTATNTLLPTDTPTNTPTPKPTETPKPTDTPEPTNTLVPTNTPKPASIPPTSAPLAEFIFQWNNPHYECQKPARPWKFRDGTQVYGIQSFQITVAIKNVSKDRIVSPMWQPTRWIITNGTATRIDTRMWQWVPSDTKQFYQQPVLSPGVVGEWTFLAFPLNAGEWVDHADWDLFGQTYRSPNFSPGEFHNSFNYHDCPTQ